MGNSSGKVVQLGSQSVKIQQQIASGVGEIFLVKDVNTKSKYVLKRVLVKVSAHDDMRLHNAGREYENDKRLPFHDNILRSLASRKLVHPNGDVEYLYLLPYCAGGTLLDLINLQPERPLARILSAFRQICSAVYALHTLDDGHGGGCIVHRDIKLENIVLHDDNHWKLLDFGSSGSDTEWKAANSSDRVKLERIIHR